MQDHDCIVCQCEGKTEIALFDGPTCQLCVDRAALRGSGAHDQPWYLRVFGRARYTTDGCWEYTGSKGPQGYASPIMVDGKLARPHVLVLERLGYAEGHGHRPMGLECDHACHNRACVNPEHLRWVTHQENCRNRQKPSRTTEEKRLRWNAYMRGYYARNRETINARRRI